MSEQIRIIIPPPNETGNDRDLPPYECSPDCPFAQLCHFDDMKGCGLDLQNGNLEPGEQCRPGEYVRKEPADAMAKWLEAYIESNQCICDCLDDPPCLACSAAMVLSFYRDSTGGE